MHRSIMGALPAALAAAFAAIAAAHAQSRLPEVRIEAQRVSPLNNDARSDSASLLGLSARETPATVIVIDRGALDAAGVRSVSEAAQAALGVIAGDNPAEPSAFSMRGFSGSQINTLYNGIKIGPQNMTSRVMDVCNLDRIEIIKGPAALTSGEGAVGGVINFVTRKPHAGPIENEAHVSYGSFGTWRACLGSGGSTAVQGLDYRVDVSRASSNGYIDDSASRNVHVSGQLDYRVSGDLKLWIAAEYKEDRSSAYWGTPLVPAAFSGANAAGGIVSGTHVSSYNGSVLGPVTLDNRTLKTNYNVLDNRNSAEEYFVRGGFDWTLGNGLTLRDHLYYYTARREWFNNEVIAFNTAINQLDRERFYVAHDQSLVGNKLALQWDTRPAGLDNRVAAALEFRSLNFDRPGAANFPFDNVNVVDPARGTYGVLTTRKQSADIRTTAVAVEDRLKLSPALSLFGGVRHETINLDRASADVSGASNPGYPFSRTFQSTTGRAGVTFEAAPGYTLYAQYATAADLSANNLFLLGPTQRLELTRARTWEAGIKHLLWDRKAEWQLAVYDINRRNVYAAAGGQTLNLAGSVHSRGAELSAAVRPVAAWTLWANAAYNDTTYHDFGAFTGNTPPNVPHLVANAGTSYRFSTATPLEIGASVRHVGDRFHSDANTVKLLAYTVGDAFAAADVGRTRITFRVRNLTNEKYAIWSDPFYPDQILLGAPRSYELSASMKF